MATVKLIEVFETRKSSQTGANFERAYNLREVFVNPDYVICLRQNKKMTQLLAEGTLPEGLDSRQEFTQIYLNRGQTGIDITVVGEPIQIQKQLHAGKKTLLKG